MSCLKIYPCQFSFTLSRQCHIHDNVNFVVVPEWWKAYSRNRSLWQRDILGRHRAADQSRWRTRREPQLCYEEQRLWGCHTGQWRGWVSGQRTHWTQLAEVKGHEGTCHFTSLIIVNRLQFTIRLWATLCLCLKIVNKLDSQWLQNYKQHASVVSHTSPSSYLPDSFSLFE